MSVQLIKRQSFHIRLRTSKAPRPDQHSHSSYTEGREWVRIADFAAFPGEVRLWRRKRDLERNRRHVRYQEMATQSFTTGVRRKADEVDGSRSRHHSATVGLLSGNPSQGAIRHADYHRGP